jgi:hypothetical protein
MARLFNNSIAGLRTLLKGRGAHFTVKGFLENLPKTCEISSNPSPSSLRLARIAGKSIAGKVQVLALDMSEFDKGIRFLAIFISA